MSRRAGRADFRDDGEDHVFAADAGLERAVDDDAQRLRLLLPQALRREDLLQLRCADAERERAERAVRRGVRVAAGDREARLRDAELGPDDVHDALARIVDAEVQDVVLARVVLEELDHAADLRVGDARDAALAPDGRHVMIRGGESLARLAHLAAFLRERAERVERAFVHEIAVDVEQRFAFALHDHVLAPDLVTSRAG